MSEEQRAGGPETGLPWWPADRGRPERTTLTRAQIVAAAIRLLDTEDLESLSMRRLGQELGAGATSLYWHVKNKDELLDLVLDEIMGEMIDELVFDPATRWQDQVAHSARELRRVILRHRGAAILLGSRVTMGPKTAEVTERTVAIFRRAGFTGKELVLAFQAVSNFAGGYAVFEARGPSGPLAEGRTSEELADVMADLLAALPADRYPNLIALGEGVRGMTDDDQFEYGLARIIDGLEVALRRHRKKRADGSA